MKNVENIVVTKNIVLAFPDEKYGEDLNFIIMNEHNRLLEWLPWVENYSGIEDSKIFQGISAKNFIERRVFTFTILFERKAIGVVATHQVDFANKRSTLGYWIGQEHEGKGIVSQSMKSLIDFCFNELNLNKLEIWCAVENVRSNKIPQKLGFKHEGVLRQVEKNTSGFLDVNVWGMIKNEW